MIPLPRDVRQLVNRLAHAHGARHAEAVKRRLLVELDTMREAGAGYPELVAHVEAFNVTPTLHPSLETKEHHEPRIGC